MKKTQGETSLRVNELQFYGVPGIKYLVTMFAKIHETKYVSFSRIRHSCHVDSEPRRAIPNSLTFEKWHIDTKSALNNVF